jgi:ElaB/YqjD/DUF883 family membrane-anchored ribosome-binding protein
MSSGNETAVGTTKPRTITQDLKELGGMAREMAQEKVEQVQTSATDFTNESCKKVRQVGNSFEKYVGEHPLKSMLIAAGVGMLFGRFWMRR